MAGRQAVWPDVPDVVKVKFDKSLDLKRVHPRIQASGLMSSYCEWRISDNRLTYSVNPVVLVQAAKASPFSLCAKLHVEVRQTILYFRHKAYGVSLRPRSYVFNKKTAMLLANEMQADEVAGDLEAADAVQWRRYTHPHYYKLMLKQHRHYIESDTDSLNLSFDVAETRRRTTAWLAVAAAAVLMIGFLIFIALAF